MNRIGTALLALCLTAGFTQAASKHEHPDATLQLRSGSVAAGIGINWGKGTLTYRGMEYPVSVKGLSLGKVGISEATASGRVYNLKNLRDFDCNYTAVGAGLTLIGGGTAVTMTNQNGVRVDITSTTRGVDLTIGDAGIEMRIKK